jgi:hypothetical protein
VDKLQKISEFEIKHPYNTIFFKYKKKSANLQSHKIKGLRLIKGKLFKDWFFNCFIPEVKAYLKDIYLDFKVLLLVDNTAGHPKDLYHPNLNVIFLPPNTTSLIQPIDQGIPL